MPKRTISTATPRGRNRTPGISSAAVEERISELNTLLNLLEPEVPLLTATMTRQERSLAAKMGGELRAAKMVNKGADGFAQVRAASVATLRDAVLHLRLEYKLLRAAQLMHEKAREERSETAWHRATCAIVRMVPGHAVISAPCGRPCRCTCTDDKHAVAYCYPHRNTSRAYLDRLHSGRNPYKKK